MSQLKQNSASKGQMNDTQKEMATMKQQMKERRDKLDGIHDKGEQIKHASSNFLQMCQELNEKNGGPKAPVK